MIHPALFRSAQAALPISQASFKNRSLKQRLAAGMLIVLLVPVPGLTTPVLRAQESVPAIQTSAPLTLHINILEGDDALNNVRERTAREPIVQIEDTNHKPVAGVAVVFTLVPGSNGAGGTFSSLSTYRTITDTQGKAVGHGLQTNKNTGQFTIQVVATLGTLTAVAIIKETNTDGGGAGSSASVQPATPGGFLHFFSTIPKWVVVGVVAGAAAGIAIGVTNGQSSGATVSAGGGTVTTPAASKASDHRE